jgi:hypothetical protein
MRQNMDEPLADVKIPKTTRPLPAVPVEERSMKLEKRRRVKRPTALRIPYDIAVQIAGHDRWADAPTTTLRMYHRDGVPASEVSSELWRWYQGLQGPVPPPPREPPLPGLLQNLLLHARSTFMPVLGNGTPPTPRHLQVLRHLLDQMTFLAENLIQAEIIREHKMPPAQVTKPKRPRT